MAISRTTCIARSRWKRWEAADVCPLYLRAVGKPSALQGWLETPARRGESQAAFAALSAGLANAVPGFSRWCQERWVLHRSAFLPAQAGVYASLCGLSRNGLRGWLLIRHESFLSSAPFPHSHLCGCFCLKQIGLQVDEAAPMGKEASVAPMFRPVSRGSSRVQRGAPEQWRQLAPAPGAGHRAAVCSVTCREAGQAPGPRWPRSQ